MTYQMQSVFGPTMQGVPNPRIPHVHPYPTRFHGPIWTSPVFGLPYRSQPYLNALPGYEAQWLQLQGVGTSPDGLGEPLLCSTTGNTLMDAAFGAAAGYFVAPKHGNTVVWAVAGAGAAMLAGLVGVIGVAGAGLLARSGKRLALANPRAKARRNARKKHRSYSQYHMEEADLRTEAIARELPEMKELLRRYGYSPADAKVLSEEGMGPGELEHRLKYDPDDLVRTHRLRRVHANGRSHGFGDIRVGDRVTLLTAHGQERTGRVVMRGPAGWVLNLGGRHGTPGIVNEGNFVRIARKKARQ
jgi:hypothetical protein